MWKDKKKENIFIIGALMLVVVSGGALIQKLSQMSAGSIASEKVVNGDLVIPINEISKTAAFYPVEIEGTYLEVLAVEAPDGTIRTAFNTCQVCYDSGRGYYVQDRDVLVCQNCGNRYPMSKVEITRGGCNPVPIFPEEKIVDETSITITEEYLTEASVMFANWRNIY